MTFEHPHLMDGSDILDLFRYPEELEEYSLDDISAIMRRAGFRQTRSGVGNNTTNL